jgi:hypothetical protein
MYTRYNDLNTLPSITQQYSSESCLLQWYEGIAFEVEILRPMYVRATYEMRKLAPANPGPMAADSVTLARNLPKSFDMFHVLQHLLNMHQSVPEGVPGVFTVGRIIGIVMVACYGQ